MRDPVTVKQQEALQFLRAYISAYHRPPSWEEIRVGLGLASKGTVSRLIVALEKRGMVRRNIGLKRSLEVVDQGGAESVDLNHDVAELLKKYAAAEHLTVKAAANALLRDALEAA